MSKHNKVQVWSGVARMASAAWLALSVMAGAVAQPADPVPVNAQVEVKDQIAEVVRAQRQTLMVCYEEALVGSPALAGKITVSFMINPAGDVTSAAVQDSTLAHDALERCVLSTLLGWRFPARPGDEPLAVSYPFKFATEADAAPKPE